MKEDMDSLLELVHDVRAHLLDARSRGLTHLPVEAAPVQATPAQVELADPPVVTPKSSSPSPQSSPTAWARLASADRKQARATMPLSQVREQALACLDCGLAYKRRCVVFGRGASSADLMIIGDVPTADEEAAGAPIAGPGGQMLDRMLQAVLGLQREQVYISNVLKCRPPNDRAPHRNELNACHVYIEREIAAVSPKLILLLGTTAFKRLFATTEGIKKHRGRWRDYRGIPVMPTYHPSYLIRYPNEKRATFSDLQETRARYDAIMKGR